MEEKELERLFEGVLESADQDNASVRRVFYTLIRATLKYRDDVMADTGNVVTVSAVQESLDWLPYVMAVGNMPDALDDLCRGLLEVWVEALKGTENIQ